MDYESMYETDADQYEHWYPLMKNFIRHPTANVYRDIFSQRIATAGTGVHLYTLGTMICIVVSSIIITILGNKYANIIGIETELSGLLSLIAGQCQLMIVMVFYLIGIAGLVHVGSTVVLEGSGEFDKMIFSLFAVLGLGAMALSVMFLGVFLLAQLGETVYVLIRILWGIASLGVFSYLLYCYVLSVKTVYRFGWAKAVGGGIVVPLMIIGSCVGALVYTWAGKV